MGKIACHYSHIAVLKKFYNSNYKNCFIFEDDLKELDLDEKEYNKRIKNVMTNIPSTYDLIYFGRCWDKCHKQIYLSEYLVRSFFPQCRHAYGVTKKGAKTIIEKSLPMSKGGGDKIIANLIYNNVLEAYSVTPPIFNQNRETLGSNLSNNDNLNECYRVKKKRRKKIVKKKFIEGFSDKKNNKKNNKKTIYNKLKNYIYNKNNLIFTTYFCNNKDVHHDKFAPCDDIRYIGNWYYSMKKLNLYGIVFHDSKNKEFIKKYTTKYIRFIYVDSNNFDFTLNDQRFLIYLDFINKNKNIKNVFMTDGNDVTIKNDPFLNIDEKNIYIGYEENTIEEKMDWFNKKCVKKDIIDELEKYNLEKIFNAGIIGGSRDNVLNLLILMKNYFSKYGDKECDINMQILNIVANKHIQNSKKKLDNKDINSRFTYHENYRDDVIFIHK